MQSGNITKVAATAQRLSRETKLRKILLELNIDSLFNSVPHKQFLVKLIFCYFDIYAKNDFDVNSTNFTFHKINTSDVCLL